MLTFLSGCTNDTGTALGGPYDFTVTVHHRPVLAFPVPRAVHNGQTLTIAAHYPDGTPISGDLTVQVYGRSAKKAHLLGTGAAANGQAAVKLAIPASERGQAIPMYARASGTSYLTASTSARLTHVR